MLKIKNIIKNTQEKKKQVITIDIPFNLGNETLIEGQKKYNRIISSKQISPNIMERILNLYLNSKSISEISRIVSFSRKAIKNNLEKCKEVLDPVYVKETKFCNKDVYFYKQETRYSLNKWCINWILNSSNKSYKLSENSKNKYSDFINWYNHWIIGIKDKVSVDFILYYWNKYIDENGIYEVKTPTKQTIYNWFNKNKYCFDKKDLIKLSKGLYTKKKQRKSTKIYDDAKPISEFIENNISWDKSYEIDLVKGKRDDKKAILTCLHKKTRMLYGTIVEPNAISVKNSLERLIRQNKLDIENLIIDNGSENVLLYQIKSIKQIYRCKPYCSSDKGQIENVHRLLRYSIKKGNSINMLLESQLQEAIQKVNNYPRRIYENDKLMSAIEFYNQK